MLRRYKRCIDLNGCLTSPLHDYMVALVPNGLTKIYCLFFFSYASFELVWLIGFAICGAINFT